MLAGVSDADEESLIGGFVAGAARVGSTVRRAASPRSTHVRQLLDHFATAGWTGAPRFLGYDEQGREILEFLNGDVPAHPDTRHTSDEALARVARLVREFHDLTAGTPLARLDGIAGEVVCHNDLSPKNTIYRDTPAGLRPVAIIDWDIAAPGRRIHDVAHVCWQFLDLGHGTTNVSAATRGVQTIADAYGLYGRDELVETILWWQDRCWRGIVAEADAGLPHALRLRAAGAIEEVRDAYGWVLAHRAQLEAGLR